MERLGTVERVAQRLAIVRTSEPDASSGGEPAPSVEPPAVGASVVDEDLADVGSVVDVFGPVERPFVAVSPDDGVHLPATVGQALYVR